MMLAKWAIYLSTQSPINVGSTLLTFLSFHSFDSLKREAVTQDGSNEGSGNYYHFSFGSNTSWRSLDSIWTSWACISLCRYCDSSTCSLLIILPAQSSLVFQGLRSSLAHLGVLGHLHHPSFPWLLVLQALPVLHYFPTQKEYSTMTVLVVYTIVE